MTSDRYTPAGVYTLTYKETDRTLKGTPLGDGTYSYQSHVNFWMPFNGGIGFHDASWRDEFGGSIYYYSGSHGCINLSYSSAQTLYGMIDSQVPIICVYPDGFSLISDDSDSDSDDSSYDDSDDSSNDDSDSDDSSYDDSDDSYDEE